MNKNDPKTTQLTAHPNLWASLKQCLNISNSGIIGGRSGFLCTFVGQEDIIER